MITKEQLATEATNGRAFAVVNDLVHDPDRYFEELQQLALTMASHIDAQAARIAELEREVEEANEARREAQLAAQEAQTSRDTTVTQVRRELGQRISELEQDAATRDAEIASVLPGTHYMDPPDGGDVSLLVQLRRMARDAGRYRWLRKQRWDNSSLAVISEPKRNVRLGTYCPSGELLDAAIDAVIQPPRCTCPSGDGSLRWPCPRHPPESA
ncbi:hypothetical protein [Chromobacterium haemolyticum]|uniref:hypothetical protein n=1 Tax=Chromobacterium haemolyticum TaxID=394935 RepID=UPI000DEFA6A5|nr:hypothetical protein [Chromobacterium haemolyticum]